jgi:hypothetical protein
MPLRKFISSGRPLRGLIKGALSGIEIWIFRLRVERHTMSSEEMRASFSELVVGSQTSMDKQTGYSGDLPSEEGVQVTCFTEDLHDVTLHFQIIRFSKQVNKVSQLHSKL